jgi:hypothetical protein
MSPFTNLVHTEPRFRTAGTFTNIHRASHRDLATLGHPITPSGRKADSHARIRQRGLGHRAIDGLSESLAGRDSPARGWRWTTMHTRVAGRAAGSREGSRASSSLGIYQIGARQIARGRPPRPPSPTSSRPISTTRRPPPCSSKPLMRGCHRGASRGTGPFINAPNWHGCIPALAPGSVRMGPGRSAAVCHGSLEPADIPIACLARRAPRCRRTYTAGWTLADHQMGVTAIPGEKTPLFSQAQPRLPTTRACGRGTWCCRHGALAKSTRPPRPTMASARGGCRPGLQAVGVGTYAREPNANGGISREKSNRLLAAGPWSVEPDQRAPRPATAFGLVAGLVPGDGTWDSAQGRPPGGRSGVGRRRGYSAANSNAFPASRFRRFVPRASGCKQELGRQHSTKVWDPLAARAVATTPLASHDDLPTPTMAARARLRDRIDGGIVPPDPPGPCAASSAASQAKRIGRARVPCGLPVAGCLPGRKR